MCSFRLFIVAVALLSLCQSTSSYVPEFISNFILYGTANNVILSATNTPTPPITPREEDRVVYAGTAPQNWDTNKYPRQSSNSTNKLIDPPIAIPDPYGWLRDDERTNTTILSYLKSENEYTNAITSHLTELQDTLYNEMLSSIIETDYSVPRPDRGYWYYSRSFQGSSYDNYYRAPRQNKSESTFGKIDWDGTKQSPILPGEQVYLDVNALAKNRTNCNVDSVSISPSQELVAYLVDYSGGEVYEVHIKNLTSGETLAAYTKREGGKSKEYLKPISFVWGKDDSTFYYTTEDERKRPYRLYVRKNWRSDNFTDTLLKEETDVQFNVGVYKSRDEKYMIYSSESKETSEVWYKSLEDEDSEFNCISPRMENVLYSVDHAHGMWYIVSDIGNSTNMKFMTAPVDENSISADQWELVVDNDGQPIFDGTSLETTLDEVTVFSSHVVLEGRENGIPSVWTYQLESKELVKLVFDDAAYDVGLSTNYEFDVDKVAISYSSMLTPSSVYEISLNDVEKRSTLKAHVVPGYDQELYGTDRFDVLSRDGTTYIPISVVYNKDTMEKVVEDGERVHVHLYGYGKQGTVIFCSSVFF